MKATLRLHRAVALGFSVAVALLVACDGPPRSSDADQATVARSESDEPSPKVAESAAEPAPEPVAEEAFWTYATDGELWSDPIFVDADPPIIIFGSDDGYVHAVDPRNGRRIWRHRAGAKIRRPPELAGDKVLVLDEDGALHSLDVTTGIADTVRRLAPSAASAAEIAFGADGETIFFGDPAGTVTRRHLDGRTLWQSDLGDSAAPRALALGAERLYVVAGDGQIHALDRLSGSLLWAGGRAGAAQLDGDTRSAPVPFEHDGRERLFVSGGGFLWCLDAVDGRERWRRLTHEFVWASPKIDTSGTEPRVSAAGGDSLFVFSLTGELRRQRVLEGPFRSGPVQLGSYLAIGSGDHLLSVLDADGLERWRFETDALITAALAGQENRLLFGSVEGDLFGLKVDIAAAAPTTATPARIHVGPTFFDGTPELHRELRLGSMIAPPRRLEDGILVWTEVGPTVLDGDGKIRWKKAWASPVPPGDVLRAVPVPGPTVPGPTVPGPTVPGPGRPGPAVPGPAVPGPAVPGPTVPGGVGQPEEQVVAVDPAGRLHALAAVDGAVRWSVPDGKRAGLPIRNLWTTPDRKILVGTEDGEVAAFSHAGELLWRVDVGALASQPRTHEGAVLVGTAAAEIVALNGDNGRELWRRPTRAAVSAPVLSHFDTVFVGDTGGTVYALDPAIGGERWSRALGGSFQVAAAALYSTVFVCGDDGRVTALDARSGLPTWRFELGDRCTGLPAVHDGMLYVGTFEHRLHALNAINGEELWRLTGGAPILGVAVELGLDGPPRIWIGDRDGHLSVVALP